MESLNNKTVGNSQKQEIPIYLTVCLVIAASSIVSLFNGIIRSFFILPIKLDTLFIYGIYLVIVLLSLKTILARSRPLPYIVISFLVLGYLITFLLNSYYDEYFINVGIDFLALSAPWLFAAYAVRDYKQFKKYLYISALIILLSYVANLFLFSNDLLGSHSYQQYYAYLLLPAALIFLDALYDKKRLSIFVFFILAFLFIISMGARGPVVCVVLYILLKIIANYKMKTKKTVYFSAFLALLGLVTYIFFYDILAKLLLIFVNYNLSTRIIAGLMEGNFFKDNARIQLIAYSVDLLKEKPLFGVGLGYDRILLADKMGSANILSEIVGWYPHNIFLEILLHFGLFFGSVAILFMIRVLYISIFKNANKYAVDTICIFMGVGFFPLLFSGSYITSPEFFALIGFCLFQYKNIKVANKVYDRQLSN